MAIEARLRANPHFATLSDGDVEALVSAMLVRDYEAGHVLVREGARGDDVHLLVSGEVSVTRLRAGTTHELNRMCAGDLFGLVSLVDDAPRSATCTTAGKCTVASLPRSALLLLMNQQADLAYAFQHALGAQLARDFRNLSQRIRQQLVAQK
ncbi:MAG: cyclic nucleotide-binding domain-containing protein [Polyangiales bacterium]